MLKMFNDSYIYIYIYLDDLTSISFTFLWFSFTLKKIWKFYIPSSPTSSSCPRRCSGDSSRCPRNWARISRTAWQRSVSRVSCPKSCCRPALDRDAACQVDNDTWIGPEEDGTPRLRTVSPRTRARNCPRSPRPKPRRGFRSVQT